MKGDKKLMGITGVWPKTSKNIWISQIIKRIAPIRPRKRKTGKTER